MFNEKQKPQKIVSPVTEEKKPLFVSEAMKPSPLTLSGNGAIKYSTTGNSFVDQFGATSQYKELRPFDIISKDCEALWDANPENAVKFMFFLRTISRTTVLPNGKKTSEPQRGSELRHEVFFRLFWLNEKSKKVFNDNIHILPIVGSWKDVFQMLKYDLSYNGWDYRRLNWDHIAGVLLAGLNDDSQRELIKKYMPHIRAKSACKTIDAQSNSMIGKWLCSKLFKSSIVDTKYYAQYRRLKSSGTQHSWQQLISQHKFDAIDFNKIHGRALSKLVNSKFLKNHDLSDKYSEWIKSPDTKEVKYTGFVHELLGPLAPPNYSWNNKSPEISVAQRETINKQFTTLVEKGKSENPDQSKLIVVRDTSGSMSSNAKGTSFSSNHIAKSLALYFSEFLEGSFANAWIEFNNTSVMHTWSGDSVCERYKKDISAVIGGTNFQSVIDLFCRMKVTNNIPESEFPTGILCLSDGEFNQISLEQTNVQYGRDRLKAAGFTQDYCDNFVIVLWNIANNYYADSSTKYETYNNAPNTHYFSGYSGSVISFLTSKIKNPEELFEAAMDQEVLKEFVTVEL